MLLLAILIKLTRAASAEQLTNGANIDTNMKSKTFTRKFLR
jgi:hypothetical protein